MFCPIGFSSNSATIFSFRVSLSLTDSWCTNRTCKCLRTHRSTRWEPSHSGVLPGGSNVRRNRCAEISVPDGRWRHRVCHCHYKTDQWDKLDQILDGKTGTCPILRAVVRDSEGGRPHEHRHVSFWSFGMAWTSGRQDSARSSPETSSWCSYPHPSLHLCTYCLWNFLVDKVASLELKDTNNEINSRREIPARGLDLANKWWGGRDWAWSFHLADCWGFFPLLSVEMWLFLYTLLRCRGGRMCFLFLLSYQYSQLTAQWKENSCRGEAVTFLLRMFRNFLALRHPE